MTTLRELLVPGLTGCVGHHGTIDREVHRSPVVGAWRQACRRCLGVMRAKMTEERSATTGQNYHVVGAVSPAPVGHVQIALHVILPFVGAWRLVTKPDGNAERAYWDPPLNASELPEGMIVVPAAVLAQRFVPEAWMRDLIEDSWTDVRVHRPGTVGELVFNWYD